MDLFTNPVEKKVFEYRPYQRRGIDKIIDFCNQDSNKPRFGVYVAPVAAGKSIIQAHATMGIRGPILILQPNKELLGQNHAEFIESGGEATIYCASLGKKEISKITYGTLQSVIKKAQHFKDIGVKTIMIDECHLGFPPRLTSQFSKLLKILEPRTVLGLTATPVQLQGSGSGAELKFITRQEPRIFKEIVDVVQISEVLEYWPKRVYKEIDFDEKLLILNSKGTKFTDASVAAAVEANNVNKTILHEILKLVNTRKAILVFVDTVKNGKKFAEYLLKKGIKAGILHGELKTDERDEIVESFKAGNIQVLFNHTVLTTGFSYKEVDCVILGRPTNSFALYYQKIGRGLRMSKFVDDCLIYDFCGNIKRFGYVDNIVIEMIPEYGWAMTNNDRVLTNQPLKDVVYKYDLIARRYLEKRGLRDMTFGPYSGASMKDLPIKYMTEFSQKIQEQENKGFDVHQAYIKIKECFIYLIELKKSMKHAA